MLTICFGLHNANSKTKTINVGLDFPLLCICCLLYAYGYDSHMCGCHECGYHVCARSCVCMPCVCIFMHSHGGQGRAWVFSNKLHFTLWWQVSRAWGDGPLLSPSSCSMVTMHLVTLGNFLYKLQGFELRTSHLHSRYL